MGATIPIGKRHFRGAPACGNITVMRVQIVLDDEVVAELDRRAGELHRDMFISESIQRGLFEQRWDDIESALGTIRDSGHAWDDDPAAWAREQRRSTRETFQGRHRGVAPVQRPRRVPSGTTRSATLVG